MKKLITSSLFILVAACSLAQDRKQRLAGEATYYNTLPGGCCNFVLRDSSVYKYSGARHSKLDFISLNWSDFSMPYVGGQPTPIARINGIVIPNNIDSLVYARTADFDTLAYYRVDASGKPFLRSLYTCEYYPDGKLRHASDNVQYDFDFIYYFGDLNRSRELLQGDTAWRYFVRDADGNVVIDYIDGSRSANYRAVDSIKVQYEFDSYHRYTSRTEYWGNATRPEAHSLYEYYSDGKVKQISTGWGHWPGNPFDPGVIDSFGYTPGVPGYTSRNFYYSDNGISLFRDSAHINSNGRVDTFVRTNGGGQKVATFFAIEYNSVGNPSVVTSYLRDSTRTDDYTRHFYYYEDYAPSLSAESITKAPITLSPNPTTGAITLHYPDVISGASLSIAIYNSTGQLVLSTTHIAAGADIPISLPDAAAPGLYYIRVMGEVNTVLYRSAVIKQ